MDRIIDNPSVRHEFVLLYEAIRSNPNGDPDAGNAPRVDPETQHGLVSDVAIKRKIRDYLMQRPPSLPMFIQSEAALNTLKAKAADKLNPPLSKVEREGKRPIARLQAQLCADYFDIRMFGAVLATGDKESGDRLNAGQVRGPVQINFSCSCDPVLVVDQPLTRQARTTEKRMTTGTTEFGRKSMVMYGLYRAHGFFNPFLAERTGVTADDMAALWEALTNLFLFDRSAARPDLHVRGLYVFSHDSKLGNAPAHVLFDLVTVARAAANGSADQEPPRTFNDYEVRIAHDAIPAGVTLTPLVS